MTTASPINGSNYSNTGQAGAYANSAYTSSTNGSNNMYSQHGHHLHANAYGSSTANANSNHHTSSTDTGLAPQSSFDTVPGSQHTGSLHQSPSSGGGGGWGQSMHYSNSTNGANAYGSQAHSMYGSGGYYGSAGAQTPSGAVTGSNGAGSGAYSAYGMQPHQGQNAGTNPPPPSAYSGSGALAGGLNGSTGGGGSAHHSGSSTPTSQTPYHHQHPHSVGSVFPSPQGYPTHHQGGYYGAHGNASSNSVNSPTGYQRASSQSANGSMTNGQVNPPPLMRSNTTPNAPLAPGAYSHTNGYSSAPGHSPSGHLSTHMGGGGSNGGAIPQRPSPVDRRVVTPFDMNESFEGGYAGMMKPRTHSGYKRELQGSSMGVEQQFAYDERA
ncbi:hypothetical protein L7F22_039049 [Adiantum nelumboides]|nr:hypothetical protein [Adiantum nelumboides]